MLLKDLLLSVPGTVESRGNLGIPIGDLTMNSRDTAHNGLFFCISGSRVDAHDFAPQAVEKLRRGISMEESPKVKKF